jgi:HprK-related kinase A
LNVSSLSLPELAEELRHNGIHIWIGGYLVHIQSPLALVAQGLHQLYADYPLEFEPGFSDFHISVDPPKNLRRWFAPQVIFRSDSFIPFKPLPADQAYPLLEWGLNWCISTLYHRYLVIHGAVIEKNGRAMILPAPPGSGKSTLCAALVTRGWRLLSDELTLVSLDTLAIVPMCRPISLKNESISVIQSFEKSVIMGRSAHDTSKGTVAHMKAPVDSVMRSQETAAPAWVVFPKYEAGVATQLSEHGKAGACMKIADNTFNYSMLGLRGFHTASNLIEQCDCYSLHYSNLDEAIARFNDLAER